MLPVRFWEHTNLIRYQIFNADGEIMPEFWTFVPLACCHIFSISQTFSLESVTIFLFSLIGCSYLKYTFKAERACLSHQAMHHITLIYITSQIKSKHQRIHTCWHDSWNPVSKMPLTRKMRTAGWTCSSMWLLHHGNLFTAHGSSDQPVTRLHLTEAKFLLTFPCNWEKASRH